MEVMARCPECATSLIFRDPNPSRGTPLVARCAPCATTYTLWGGHISAAADGAHRADRPASAEAHPA